MKEHQTVKEMPCMSNAAATEHQSPACSAKHLWWHLRVFTDLYYSAVIILVGKKGKELTFWCASHRDYCIISLINF